jgi:acetate kinase
MKILVINTGSSTIKYGLFEMGKKDPLLKKGIVEKVSDYPSAMHAVWDQIDLSGIEAVGHRVVHGGEKFIKPTLIDGEVIEEIKKVGRFVPLHSTPNLIGIEVSQEILPSAFHVAVFDTAAYSQLTRKTYLYAIPYELYEEHQIRKYGFHGINHSYVAEEAAKLLNKKDLKVITCHLGSGCSITAFENGVAKETSMGLTPLEGLVMGTRSGDIDPSIVLYLMEALKLSTQEISDLLNKKSGLVGLCGKKDMRDIISLAASGDDRAAIAIEIFIYRLQKYIGGYIAVLKGVDAIVFTGGIGENSADIRSKVCEHFSYIGVIIEKGKNQTNASVFSTSDSKVTLLNIAAQEEWVIAGQTELLVTGAAQ